MCLRAFLPCVRGPVATAAICAWPCATPHRPFGRSARRSRTPHTAQINRNQLRDVVTSLGLGVAIEDVDVVFSSLDPHGTGTIDLSDLTRELRANRRVLSAKASRARHDKIRTLCRSPPPHSSARTPARSAALWWALRAGVERCG